MYDESEIPAVLSRETVMSTRTYIEDEPFFPIVYSSKDWSHLFGQGVPEMNAYIATTKKGRATTILQSEKEDPVMASWQYGLGKTIAWTSDVEGKWAGRWASWDVWPTLWNEIVTWTFPSTATETFSVKNEMKGTTTYVTFQGDVNLISPLRSTVLDEKGLEVESTIRLTAPGEYQVAFEGETGNHFIQMTEEVDGEPIPFFQTAVTVPYSPEYNIAPINQRIFDELVSIIDGGIGDEHTDVFRPLEQKPKTKQELSHQLILIAFLLFFIEIVLRRFGVPEFFSKLSIRRNAKALVMRSPTAKAKVKSTNKLEKIDLHSSPTQEVQTKEGNVNLPQIDQQKVETMKRLIEAKNRRRK